MSTTLSRILHKYFAIGCPIDFMEDTMFFLLKFLRIVL
jgi:hypothetical protein